MVCNPKQNGVISEMMTECSVKVVSLSGAFKNGKADTSFSEAAASDQ